MGKIKWGVLGTADIAMGCTIPGMKLADNCELYAIAGRKAEKVGEFKDKFGFAKGYTDYNELLADSTDFIFMDQKVISNRMLHIMKPES